MSSNYNPIFPSHWTKTDLYSIGEWINGLAFKKMNFNVDGKYPVIKINELKYGITGQTAFTDQVFDPCYSLFKGDLLFSWSGSPETSIDAFWYDLQEGWLNQHIFKVIPNEDISKEFVYYLLKYIKPEIIRIAKDKQTTGLGHITKGDMKQLNIAYPNLLEQKRIVNIVKSIDDKIDLNRQTNQTLEAIAQALFKEWFVDFNFPGATSEMVESELGMIPKGWKTGKLRDIVELNPKLSIKKGKLAKYVEMKDLSQTSLSIEKFIEREFSSGSKFQNHDTLFARITPCLENGKTGFVNFLDENETGWGSTEFIVLRSKSATSFFVYCLSRYNKFREFAIQSMVGSSGRQRVVESILSDFLLPIPQSELLDLFQNIVEPLFAQIKDNHDQTKTLIALRDNLLPRLMKGEISFKPLN